jgi:hypothetical protein
VLRFDGTGIGARLLDDLTPTSNKGVNMSELEFSTSEAIDVLKPLALLMVEIFFYSVFVFAFYRFLARRDIVTANLNRYNKKGYKLLRAILYLFQHVLLFPILTVCWGAVLVVILALLGKDQPAENILLVTVALISAIRATAYVTEDLSRDLAKMLPFAVLGLYLVNKSYVSLSVSSGVLKDIPDYWEVIVYYIIFVVALEFVLKIGYGFVSSFKKKSDKNKCDQSS